MDVSLPMNIQNVPSHNPITKDERSKRRGYLRDLCTRQGGRCFWCGELMIRTHFKSRNGNDVHDDSVATIDHLVVFALRGATDMANCVAACKRCNELRGRFNSRLIQRDMAEMRSRLQAAEGGVAELERRLLCAEQARQAAEHLARMYEETLAIASVPRSGLWKRLFTFFFKGNLPVEPQSV